MLEQEHATVQSQQVNRVTSIPIRPEQSAIERKNQTPRRSYKGIQSREQSTWEASDLKGVYVISVAARLVELHPQVLRKYERLGLVSPSRTNGMRRLYSDEDIAKLRLIKYLEDNLGFNLAGVEFTLNLLTQLLEMRRRLDAAEEMERFRNLVEQEMDRLFRMLNLPL